MPIRVIILLFILIITIINIILTIQEIFMWYQDHSCGAHPGRIRGASEVGLETDVSFYEYLNGLEGDDLYKALDVIIDNGRFIDDLK